MNALHQLHVEKNAATGVYNGKIVPCSYHAPDVEYKAVRETALLVDYSHMSIVRVLGEDAWSLVNYLVSADISTLRDEQGMYSLLLNEDGTLWGDTYVLCSAEGYYLLSENLSAVEIVGRLEVVLADGADLDIQEVPEITMLDEQGWGAIQLEGPYAWELLAELYGFDIIGLPFNEYMTTEEDLLIFRCGRHGEFAYQIIGQQDALAALWTRLLESGEKFDIKTGGLDYLQTVRVENPCWTPSLYAGYTADPVALQLQWAIQYDKDGFIGQEAVLALSARADGRKLVGLFPSEADTAISANDKVQVDGKEVGVVVKGIYSPALQSYIALALLDREYACSDIDGFSLQTAQGCTPVRTQNVPFIYNVSLLVNPTEHSYVDPTRAKNVLSSPVADAI